MFLTIRFVFQCYSNCLCRKLWEEGVQSQTYQNKALDYASILVSLSIMALNVAIKHAGRAYDVKLDPSLPPSAFKQSISEVTGVPVDRLKVMIKGGMLKCVS